MKQDTAKVSSDDVAQLEARQRSPLSISSVEFQQKLDLLINANPTFDCPSLRCPPWLSECAAGFRLLPWPRQKNKFASIVANLMTKIRLR